jgi:hypothetical protein
MLLEKAALERYCHYSLKPILGLESDGKEREKILCNEGVE